MLSVKLGVDVLRLPILPEPEVSDIDVVPVTVPVPVIVPAPAALISTVFAETFPAPRAMVLPVNVRSSTPKLSHCS